MPFSVELIPATPGRTLVQENAYASQRLLDVSDGQVTAEILRISNLNAQDRKLPATVAQYSQALSQILRLTQAVEYLALALAEATPGGLSNREVLLKFLNGVQEYDEMEINA
jgi:hypothetical protein